MMVQLTFGQPEYGWLPVDFQSEGFHLELDVSDVPVNPLDELCSTLIRVLQGERGEMGWHLEPAWYYFRFETNDRVITLTILASERHGLTADAQFSVTGTLESLVLPMYRALKGFDTTNYGTHWPAADLARIKKLTEMVKARKEQA